MQAVQPGYPFGVALVGRATITGVRSSNAQPPRDLPYGELLDAAREALYAVEDDEPRQHDRAVPLAQFDGLSDELHRRRALLRRLTPRGQG